MYEYVHMIHDANFRPVLLWLIIKCRTLAEWWILQAENLTAGMRQEW